MTVKTWRRNSAYLTKLITSKSILCLVCKLYMIMWIFTRSGKMPGPAILGLDHVNAKTPKKPEKKRIASSVLLSSIKRLGMCMYVYVCVCVPTCVYMHMRVWVCLQAPMCVHAHVCVCVLYMLVCQYTRICMCMCVACCRHI